MSVSRRDFLKVAGGAGLGGVLLSAPSPRPVLAQALAADSAAMLYDSTLCVGCRACQTACKRRSNLSPVTDQQNLYEAPRTLNANNWTIIKLYKGDDGFSFIKSQCMHCLEPACVSVCPVGALQKQESGPVTYDKDKCFGCRYCMAACPFTIPKYQWWSNQPLIQKCDFCADRQANGQNPACGDACPTGALIFGKRGELLDVAHKRIKDGKNPYIDHVYGEFEGGGTSMLYLSTIKYEKLGLPTLDSYALPSITWPIMQGVPWLIVGMGGLMTAIYLYTHRNEKQGKEA
jgi:formate dehydrogenase iron-sulfur subunit